jgi:bifunctional non-homologous end joining protein LigD
MASIAAGKGRAPKPFMAAGTKPAKPNAVWDTSQGLAADQRRRRKAG